MQRSSQGIRASIVAAAIQVIGKHGVDGLTHRAVASAAGVSLSSTTYYFDSRDEIIACALDLVADVEMGLVRELAEQVYDASATDPLAARALLTQQLSAQVSENRRQWLVAQRQLKLAAASNPHLRPVVQYWTEEVVSSLARMTDALGASDPKTAARLLLAAADGLRLQELTVPGSVAGSPHVIEALMDCLLAR